MKNSNDTIGNRTRDLRACSAVPQPTAPPHSPLCYWTLINFHGYDSSWFKGEVIVIFRLGISKEGIHIYSHCCLNKTLHSLFSNSKSRRYSCKLIKWSRGTDASVGIAPSFFAESIFSAFQGRNLPIYYVKPSLIF